MAPRPVALPSPSLDAYPQSTSEHNQAILIQQSQPQPVEQLLIPSGPEFTGQPQPEN